MQNQLRFFEERDIPNSPGIYIFRLNILIPFELGIRPNSDLRSESLTNEVKRKLTSRLDKLEKVVLSNELEGQIRNKGKKFTFNQTSIVSIKNLQSIIKKSKTKINSIKDVGEFCEILAVLNEIIPPLYVGITYDQTLKERYSQHKNDWLNNRFGKFGARLKSQNISWSEVGFFAKSINISSINKDELKFTEELFHYFTNPILSIR